MLLFIDIIYNYYDARITVMRVFACRSIKLCSDAENQFNYTVVELLVCFTVARILWDKQHTEVF